MNERIRTYIRRINNKNGFTLAEVLITLGIIGVVAALTIPQLIQSTQELELRSAFKKKYSEISSALVKLNTDQIFPCANRSELQQAFARELKYTKLCASNYLFTDGCWHQSGQWYTLAGKVVDTNLPGANSSYGMILADGSYFVITNGGNSASDVAPYSLDGGSSPDFLLDVNGSKNPNRVGLDIFVGYIQADKLNLQKYSANSLPSTCNRKGTGTSNWDGAGCASYILRGISY